VTEVGPDRRVRVNCGLQHPISLVVPSGTEADEGERVTVRVSSRQPVRAKLVDETPPGFTVERTGLESALARDDAGVRIAASRHGEVLTATRLPSILEACRDGFTVLFGAPERGLPEMGLEPGEETIDDDPAGISDPAAGFDLWLNTVPNQGSEVVRTEEAMFATLAPLSLE